MALRNNYLIHQVQSGDEIEVWWPADKQYYPGIIDEILSNGRYHITYMDGEEEVLRLSNERWRFRGNAAERVSQAHSVSPKKRSRNLFTTHEPEPIVIDDDEDESPPKRARHKQRTHHSSDAVIALDGALSLSTQQSDVEIEEVPVQPNPRDLSDHRASDVSEPIVSDIEHEVIEEEILDTGYGGDTSSAADTSELQHHYARKHKSTLQNRPTHRKSPKTAIATKSTPPHTSVNSHKDHRNSYSAQSASLSAPINYTLPNNARSALANRPESIISPAPLAAYQLSPNPNKLPTHAPESPPLKLPASAVKCAIVSGARATGLPAKPDVRNISSKRASEKPGPSVQERSVPKPSTAIVATTSPKLTHRKGAVQDTTTNLVSQKKKASKPFASSPRMRASKAVGQTNSKEASMSKNKKSSAANSISERTARTTADMTKSSAVTVTKSKTQLTPKPQRCSNGVEEQTIPEPPHIALAPAVSMPKLPNANQSAPHGASPKAKTKMSGASPRLTKKNLQTLGGKPNRSPRKVVGLPTRNPTNVDANTSPAARKQSNLPLKSSCLAKNAKHTPQKRNGGTEKGPQKSPAPFSPGSKADAGGAQTQNKPLSTNVKPRKSLTKQHMPPTQNKMVAASTRAETQSKRPASVVSQKGLTKQLMPSTQKKTVVTKANAKAPSNRSAIIVPQTSVAEHSVSTAQNKIVVTPTQANAPSVQRTISAGDHRQAPSGSGPCTSKPTVENGCHKRPKTDTSDRESPKKKSRFSQSKSVVSGAMKATHGQSKPAAEPTNIKTNSMLKQVADARVEIVGAGSSASLKQLPVVSPVMGKKARHPSPKVVSNERIPRNKSLSVSYTSRSPRTDVPRAQSQMHEHAVSSRYPSCTAQRVGPTTPMRPAPHVSNPTPPRLHVGNTSKARDTPNTQSLATRATFATYGADIQLGSSKSITDDRKTQAQVPQPPMPKSSGSIFIQSLVSSPKDVTQPHRGSSNLQSNPTTGVLLQSHKGSAQSLALGPISTTAPRSASKSQVASTSRSYTVPLASNLPSVSCAVPTFKESSAPGQQAVQQKSSSLQAEPTTKSSNLPGTRKNQVSTMSVGNTPSTKAGLSKELQALGTTKLVHDDKESGPERRRKRSASEQGNLAGATKRRKPVSNTQPLAGLRDGIDNPKPRGSVRVLSEAASIGNRMSRKDHTTKDASVSPRGAPLQWRNEANEIRVLVTGAATASWAGSQPQHSGPLNSTAAKTPANLQLPVSTAPKVVAPSVITCQRATGAPTVTPAVSVSAELPYSTTQPNPCDPGGVGSLRPRVAPSQALMSVQPVTRISSAPVTMSGSQDMERLMSSALKTVNDKFSMLSKKTKEEFKGLKQSIDSVSKDIAQLGSRIDKVDQVCRSCSDNFLKVLEISLEKRLADMNQQIQSEARESLLAERLRFTSSSKEIAGKITQLTSTLFQTAIQDIKTAVKEDYRRIQSDVTQSSSKVQLSGETPIPTGGLPNNVGKAASSGEDRNESINAIVPGRNTEKSERQLDHALPLGFSSDQQMSDIPSHCSSPPLKHGLMNEANSTAVSNQGVDPQSLETKSNDMIARCVIEWLRTGGSRKKAPRSEREIPVTQAWVNSTALKCFNSIITRLQPQRSDSEVETDIAKSLAGKVVETEWLIRFTDNECVERARSIYNEWEPKLFDFEWLTEKKVMLEIAERVYKAQGEINVNQVQFPDALSRSLFCMKRAGDAS